MENGWKIRVAEVEHDALSVDVAEDVAKVEGLLRAASTGEKRDSSLRFPPSAGLAE